MSKKKTIYKPEIFNRRCCFNCKHHLAYIGSGPLAGTIVCPFAASYTDKHLVVRIDYDKRMPASHVPCRRWMIDTNVPKGFEWPFLSRLDATQLNLAL